MKEQKKYALAIKQGNKSYLPLELRLADTYKGEDITTLEGIDKFTLNTDIPTLFTDMINKGIIDKDDKIETLSIIFHEKGNIREIQYGPIFNDYENLVTPEAIKNFIMSNYHNKQIMNKLFNHLNKNAGTKEIDELRLILNNIVLFIAKGEKYLEVALNVIYKIDYEVMRSLALYIELVIKPKLKEEDTSKKLNMNNSEKKAA